MANNPEIKKYVLMSEDGSESHDIGNNFMIISANEGDEAKNILATCYAIGDTFKICECLTHAMEKSPDIRKITLVAAKSYREFRGLQDKDIFREP